MPSWRSMSAMSARVTVPVLERSRMEKASRIGRRCCGARRERGSDEREGFVVGPVIVDGAGVGAVGRGRLLMLLLLLLVLVLLLLLLRLFPVFSGATGVITLLLSLLVLVDLFREEASLKYEDDELSGRCCCCWLYLGGGCDGGEFMLVALS